MTTPRAKHARQAEAPRANLFVRVSSDIVGGLFLFVLVMLVALAAFSTCYISFDDGQFGNEHTFFVPDSVIVNCIVVVACVALAYFASRWSALGRFRARIEDDDRLFRICKAVILAVLAIMAVAWLGLTLAVPGADQGTIQKIVIAAQGGDWSEFGEDGYMYIFPNQIGYFWISYMFAPLFKQYTSAFMQLFNVGGLLVVCESLAAIGARLKASRFQQLATMCLCIAFYPLIMYCSFVYGILWGLGLSLLAIRFEMDFFDTWKWPRAIASALCIALAIVFKSNYQVFLIAMVLYALVALIDVRKLAALGMVVLLAASFVCSSAIPNAMTKAASGYDVGSGASSWSWIAMGLQDGKRAPGWYNRYNTKTFNAAHYDSAAQAEVAKADIRESLAAFASGERDAVAFFSKKTASQWNNPTFQGYWNVQKRRPAFKLFAPIAWFMSAEGEDAAVNYLNAVQIIILTGALFWAIGCAAPRQASRPYRIYVLPLVLLGGFLCHLFWEAKCQYILPYFTLLLPLCAMGYASAARCIGQVADAVAGNGAPLGRRLAGFARARVGALVGFALSCALVIVIGVAGGLTAVTCDKDAYEGWLASDPVCPIITKEPFMGSKDADRFM